MQDFTCFIFDLNTAILDESFGLAEREHYRLDNIYTVLEKSLVPIKFNLLKKKYEEMKAFSEQLKKGKGITMGVFQKVEILMNLLNVSDIVVFKKIYDSYIDAELQINPKLRKNVLRALELLKEREKKIGLIATEPQLPGDTIRFLLKQMGIYHFFDEMVFSCDINFPKGKALLFGAILEKMSVEPSSAIYIGSVNTLDYEYAKKTGFILHMLKPDDEDIYELVVKNSGGF